MIGPNKLTRLRGAFPILAIVGCLLVVGSIFLRWTHLTVPGRLNAHSIGLNHGYLKMAGQGFALLAFVLVLTQSDKPVRLWKPLIVGFASVITLIGLGLWRFNMRDGPVKIMVTGVNQNFPATVTAAQGFYLAFGTSMALLLFSIWQIRLSFRTRHELTVCTCVTILDAGVIIKRLRWVMLAVMIFDLTMTLYGQPPTYWENPATAREDNPLVYAVMQLGIPVLVGVSVVYGLSSVLLVSVLPRRLGGVLLLLLTLGHYFGGSTWLYFRFGMPYGAAWYAATLAVLLVKLGTENVVRTKQYEGARGN